MKTIILFLLLSFSALAYTDLGNGVLQSDGSPLDTQAAINASPNGGTVAVKAGDFTWTSGISIAKPIHLRGAGPRHLLGYSQSSHTPGMGIKTFNTPLVLGAAVGTSVAVGEQIFIGWKSDDRTYMIGTISAYDGVTLSVNVTSFGLTTLPGAGGAKNNWFFRKLSHGTRILNNHANKTHKVQLINITESAAGSVELSGIHFDFPNDGGQNGHIAVTSSPGGQPVIVHDLSFTTAIIRICVDFTWNSNQGLIYNCSADCGWQFTRGPAPVVDWESYTPEFISHIVNASSWTTPHTMGTADTTGRSNLYIENCYFGGMWRASLTDISHNSKIVIRYCIADNSAFGTHGYEAAGWNSCRHWEFYNNYFLWEDVGYFSAPMFAYFFCRGGTGIIADNYVTQITGPKVEWLFIQYGLTRPQGYGCLDCNGYPLKQQVGGGFNGTSFHADPVYIWGNSPWMGEVGATDDTDQCGDPNSCRTSDIFKPNRDYFFGAARPGYAKFQYPHPLRGGSEPPIPQKPLTVKNLRLD